MKIMVAMSGGVDSTMTAKFLKEQGHEVQGCYMKLHSKPGYHEENIRKVKKVGEYLGIKVHILDLQNEFNKYVYDPFINLYKNGKTPNPCALCNKFIKLGVLLDFAKENGCEKLATGHYIQIIDGLITSAKDDTKDQSYFLAQVPREILKDVIFPLGDKFKKDIKELAKSVDVLKEFGEQAESSEICFVDKTYIEVLQKHYNTSLPGKVVDKSGKEIGTHQGYMHYTIGKRRGFEIHGAHEPHFVLKINADKNEIVVGSKDDLKENKVLLENVNMFIDDLEFECDVKIRYRSPKIKAKAKIDTTNNTAVLNLNEDAYGVAQGQLCVMYKGDQVIASGFIA
ncbi:tRNA 2-thiouridine(34) synthase MnmA [Campylobacter pinnipediorum]|uniref:tRNA-specific 2-thiouridylase MnmA n=1 Tax=Campylobacter pinnipediorum subsp. pinnipediorum TaxID=1660067 RepID=A0AAX0LBG8_9BACT|nr:tRNA 2-thiouridine(34) synthase MnmA [Campylobacter pinnipediorum]AQW81544.1 tRNA U34 2-thiouridylase [Campylobacter pinnipediorum subsp. pinnipediorum]AQW83172.1 tRNA U34 2-thiouridylase [Campylobacter pinnipediorum subsp. pinnipediorum]AQW84739.1 tRNA U34 2-thiouridylase [Campylobacter pinnipediorum subsp. pinnipediorum]OPA79605.1 tRNA 2-thiouridine(34) synthase MnmA [Campylobacter pinnipediorum subsp. pinnipediorum]OPA81791.1 tRNA 2-thiouridine(34) synthase MnmA [Campylobacter pinnipedio